MSLASCSFQCGWLPDETTVTVSILGVNGDLEQRYTGTAANPTTIIPNWSGTTVGNGKVLRNIVMESDPTITDATIAESISDDDTTYYIDGNKLSFNSQGISHAPSSSDPTYPFDGCFRKLKANQTGAAVPVPTLPSAPFGGLEVIDNLVKASGGRSFNVKVILAIAAGNRGLFRQGSTSIRIAPITGQSAFAQIYCDSTDSFVLDEDNPDVECKVHLYEGETETTTFYRKWYLLEGGAWVQKSTADTFTVHKDDVQTFADVKVECYSDSNRTQLITSDVQTINDSSDAYIVNPCPSPDDATFSQNGTQDVTFTPTLTDKDGNQATQPHKFTYTVMDSAGVVRTNGTINPGGSFTVQASLANSMGEGPIINIEAEEV